MLFGEMLALAEYEGTRIVTVGVVSGGEILTGKRRDNGKWTSPGGHVDQGEDILTAAKREVFEEAGITLEDSQLEFVLIKRIPKGRGGFPFIVVVYLAHVDKQKATAKHDPDKEVSEWKWVPISTDTPELQMDVRHAEFDSVLIHLGVNKNEEERMKTETMASLSHRLRNAGFAESPEAPEKPQEKGKKNLPPAKGNPVEEQEPTVPEPKPKTPADMKNNPDAYLPEEEVTGDAPQERRIAQT